MQFLLFVNILSLAEAIVDSKLQNLKNGLELSLFDAWSFKKNFSDYKTLKLEPRHLSLGVDNEGERSKEAFERIYSKMMRGGNITMAVFGGSSTKGADLGCYSSKCTYHYGVQAWWNAIITPATGSYLNRQVFAVGGTGSTYYGHCWKEYITSREIIDIVLWEFYINDPDSDDYMKGLEKFVRTVLLYESSPLLLFVKFFSESLFPNKDGESTVCTKCAFKSKIVSKLAKHYGFTTFNILNPAASRLRETKGAGLMASEMFIGIHPSHLAHAQMSYIMLVYIRGKLLTHLHKTIHDCLKQINCMVKELPPKKSSFPLHLSRALDVVSICWSAVMPDDRFLMPHNIFHLSMRYNSGFQQHFQHKWNQMEAMRRDIRGGYFAYFPGSILSLEFNVLGPDRKNIYIAVSHIPQGGLTSFTLTNLLGMKQEKRFVNCSREAYRAMDVIFVGNFPHGKTELRIETLTGGCELSSIIIE